MKPTKFHSMKEYDSTKEDWKLVLIAMVTLIGFVSICIAYALFLFGW